MALESPWLTHLVRARGPADGSDSKLFATAKEIYNRAPAMKVLLLRPDPGNERFGLGPFFRVEPLGLEYVAAALTAAGHESHIVDLRFGHSVPSWVRRTRPRMVGISCMHALEYDRVRETARQIRRVAPDAFILAGG